MKVFVGATGDSEFAVLLEFKMLLMKDGDGNVSHEYLDAEIEGDQFTLMVNTNEGLEQVKYTKTTKTPKWVDKFIWDKTKNDKEFFVRHFTIVKDGGIKNRLIGKKVSFMETNSSTWKEGILVDKVCVPLASGRDKDYVPFDNYVIVDNTNNIYIVNPINLNKILQ